MGAQAEQRGRALPDHAREKGLVRRLAEPAPVRRFHGCPQRSAGRRAGRAKHAGERAIAGQVKRDQRLAAAQRGVRHLQAAYRERPGIRAGHQDSARDLWPAEHHPGAAGRRDAEHAAVPGDDDPGAGRPPGERAADRRECSGPRRPDSPLVGVHPGQPAGKRGLGGGRDQRERELPRQPAARAGERATRMQQAVERVPAAQVGEDLGRPGGESGGRRPRPYRQRPGQPGRRRDRQPPQPPSRCLAYRGEHDRQHERELREQQVSHEHEHGEGRHDLPAARKLRRNQVAGTPRHRPRPWHHLSRHINCKFPDKYPPCPVLYGKWPYDPPRRGVAAKSGGRRAGRRSR